MTSLIANDAVTASSVALLPHLQDAWRSLSSAVRQFDPDVVVLVARKMPRLVEALDLDLAPNAVCVSDQAIPFVYESLKGARVAIIDDVWNVGTTMLRARDRVQSAGPRSIRLFALGAKDANAAVTAGVNLTIARSLPPDAFRVLVEAVPRALRCVAKPYDVDFPIIPCSLKAPFSSWRDCWQWLNDKFGESAHSTVDEEQLACGVARATVNFQHISGWTTKARLYFDFNYLSCNVVPMSFAPSLSLADDYPSGSVSSAVFAAVARTLSRDRGLEEREGLARINTFCDSLLYAGTTIEALSELLRPECATPFELSDFSMQFGPTAEKNCREMRVENFRRLSLFQLNEHIARISRRRPAKPTESLMSDSIIKRTKELLQQGFSNLALDALFQQLAKEVGADDPAAYLLTIPFSAAEIKKEPYLRLRLGFTYEDILGLFRDNYSALSGFPAPSEPIVSALLDNFIDRGAVVPTFTVVGDCVRIYRKGEANPKWDEEITRLLSTLGTMEDDERRELTGSGRTRIAKINAIMSFSGRFKTALTPGAFERGNVGLLAPSVVEREGGELSRLMQRFGYLN